MVVVWMKKERWKMWEGELFVRCGGLASDCASGIGLSGVEISVERNVESK